MASTYQVFQAAEQFEKLAAELYLLLSARFADDPFARDLFRKLADEEVQHAARVRLLAAQYRNDPRLFDAALNTRGGALRDPGALLRLAAGAVEDVAAGRWGDDLDVVKARLVELEDQGAAFHAELLARGASAQIAQFFEELARQDREHQRLLAGLRPRSLRSA